MVWIVLSDFATLLSRTLYRPSHQHFI